MSETPETENVEPQETDNRSESSLLGYNRLLTEKPLLTKSITSGVVSAFGAAVGSILSSRVAANKSRGGVGINWLDVLTFALHGILVGGPINHYWSKWLEDNGPESTSSSFLLDQLVVQPQLLIVMHIFMDTSRAALREFPPSLYRTLSTIAPVISNSWRFWPFMIYCSLRFLKKKHHPISLNVCSLVWTIYLSKRRASSPQTKLLAANRRTSAGSSRNH